MGAQKSRLTETVLLSTHNICFGWEIRKLFFCYALITKVLGTVHFIVYFSKIHCEGILGPVVQSVANLMAVSGVVSLSAGWPHTFVKVDHQIFSI